MLKAQTDVAAVLSSLTNVCVEESLEAEEVDVEWMKVESGDISIVFEIDLLSSVGRLSAFQYIRWFLCAFCFAVFVADWYLRLSR